MGPPSPPNFLTALKSEMISMKEKNKLGYRGEWIPDASLRDLFDTDSLTVRLREDHHISQKELDDCVEFIKKDARRIFAILVLIDEKRLILALKKSKLQVNDDFLFKASNKYARRCCTREDLSRIPELSGVVDQFYEMQWVFPPYLSSNDILTFDTRYFRFPLKSFNPYPVGRGGNADVYQAEIDEEFLTYNQKYPMVSHYSLNNSLEVEVLTLKGYQTRLQKNQT